MLLTTLLHRLFGQQKKVSWKVNQFKNGDGEICSKRITQQLICVKSQEENTACWSSWHWERSAASDSLSDSKKLQNSFKKNACYLEAIGAEIQIGLRQNKRLQKVYHRELCYNHSQGFSTALPKHKWIIPWRARSLYKESWRNGTASKGGDQKWKDLLLKRLTKYKKKMKNWPQKARFDNIFEMQKTPLTTILFSININSNTLVSIIFFGTIKSCCFTDSLPDISNIRLIMSQWQVAPLTKCWKLCRVLLSFVAFVVINVI